MIKKIFPYAFLGLITFFMVVTTLSASSRFLPSKKQPKMTKVLINANRMSISQPASISALLNIQASLTPTSSAFCLDVPALLYHHIQPLAIAQERGQTSLTVDTTVFDQQMQYLSTHGYHSISAEELVSAVRNHTYLSPKNVVITLDDGYEDNYTDAFPIAKKYNMILNLMIPTGLLGTHPATNRYFTWEHLHEMVASKLVYAYDHTVTHYPLGLGSVEKDQFEIMTAKQQLEQNLGKPVTIFTYPYGSGQDMPWLAQLLQKDGFTGGFSTIGGSFQCESFIMSLHRYHVGSGYFPGFGIY